MIYSSVKDNWSRVVMMHSVARNYYDLTHATDFRQRVISRGDSFPFDACASDAMSNESCFVGMVMAWAVVTLESLVNHALADMISNKLLAVMAIEYPSQITQKLKLKGSGSPRSDLARKLVLLNDEFQFDAEIIGLADELADTRNAIVHDKPFSLIDHGDGEVEMEYYSDRGGEAKVFRYEHLKSFFKNCDKVNTYVLETSKVDLFANDLDFQSLLS